MIYCGKMNSIRQYLNAMAEGAALDEYLGGAIMFVVIGVAVSIGAYITSQVQTQIGTTAGVNSTAYNAAGFAVSGMSTFASWLPILAIVIVAVVIIMLLYGFVNRTAGNSTPVA